MEERLNNTIQTNGENRDQSIDQMFVATCVQESLELSRIASIFELLSTKKIDMKETIQMEIYRQTTTTMIT